MIVLIKTLQVVLALSLLIIIHEFGHFIFAKIFHIRVEKFYLFFDVKGLAICRFHIGETEFGIGWLPLGGYCKIAGMIDESMDLEQMKQEPQPWEFRSHPAWQRLFVMAGGVLFNFITAILIYIMIMGIWGSAYVSNDQARIYASPEAQEMGFRTGDHIIAFDDYHPKDFGMLQADLVRRDVRNTTVLRGNDTIQLYIDKSMTSEVLNTPGFFELAIPFIVDSVSSASPNVRCGLTHGDAITAINGQGVEYLQDAQPILMSLAGSTVDVTVRRDTATFEIPAQVDSAGRLGIYMIMPKICRNEYKGLSAVPAGLKFTAETIRGYVSDLGMIFRPSTGAYKSVGSFIAIGQVFPETWDWYRFVNILALLSIMLGVMNLLPIPALDGGHILFTLYEIFTGRKPSDKFLTVAQTIGMILILMLMVLAFGNDIRRIL